MKKLFSLVLLLVTALPSLALDVSYASFISPRQQVFITNNTTINYGYTNVQYIDSIGVLRYSLTTNSIIPVYVGGTTVNGVNQGGTAYYTNSITTNSIQGSYAWVDAPLWPDRNADSAMPPIALMISTILDNNPVTGNPTNLWTFTFARMFGTNQETVAANDLVLTIAQTGQTNQVTSTNLTTTFQGGATGLRLLTVKLANSTTNSFGQILDISLNGFKP